jgi:hypothetical protein
MGPALDEQAQIQPVAVVEALQGGTGLMRRVAASPEMRSCAMQELFGWEDPNSAVPAKVPAGYPRTPAEVPALPWTIKEPKLLILLTILDSAGFP